MIPTLGGQQHQQRSVTKLNNKITKFPIIRKLVSGQLKFRFYTSKSTMTIISLCTAIVVTALTLIFKKNKYPPQISL